MKYCDAFQIEVPDSFPLAVWEAFYASGKSVTDNKREVGAEFVLAMGCVVYRFKACKDSIDVMVDCWNASGKNLSFGDYFTMQKELFSFFSCGISVIESLLYSIYVAAAQKHPAAIPWSDQRARKSKSDPSKLANTLSGAYPTGHQVITDISNLVSSQEWKDWNDYRNTMVHRSLPSRIAEGSMGGPPPPNEMVKYAKSWSHPELRATETGMEAKLVWLAGHVEKISTAAAAI